MYVSKEYKSPLGVIRIVSTDKGVNSVIIGAQDIPQGTPGDPFGAACQLEDYFAGKLTDFKLPLDIDVSAFTKRVLDEVVKIPYGKTITYSEIASRTGSPKAFRAAGSAVGRNPVPIIIPCHRVLGKHSLGGYAFGLDIKKALLDLEGVKP